MSNRGGVCGGHYDGANCIPKAFWTRPEYQRYSEGTTMHLLANAICAAHPGWYNARPEAGTAHPWTPNFGARATRMQAHGITHAFELHTNWSLHDSKTPNRGVFLVIISLCYEAGINQAAACAAEKALATKLWKPLADKLGLKFEVRTRKGGGKWDYYSFINECKRRKIAHPMIIEHGYHPDFAEHKDAWLQAIPAYYEKIEQILGMTSVPPVLPPPAPTPVYFTTTATCYTLWAVGKKFGVDYRTIKLANGGTPNSQAMKAGIKLRIK